MRYTKTLLLILFQVCKFSSHFPFIDIPRFYLKPYISPHDTPQYLKQPKSAQLIRTTTNHYPTYSEIIPPHTHYFSIFAAKCEAHKWFSQSGRIASSVDLNFKLYCYGPCRDPRELIFHYAPCGPLPAARMAEGCIRHHFPSNIVDSCETPDRVIE